MRRARNGPAGNAMLNLRRVGVLANLEKSGMQDAFAHVSEWAGRKKYELVSNTLVMHEGPTLGNPFGVETSELTRMFADVDVLISLGGDGTLLYAAQLIARAGVPVLSVNLGSLGFHTQVGPHDLAPCLERMSGGDFAIERRMMLQAEIPGNSEGPQLALNDIVVSKSAWGHMVTLRLGIDGKVVTDISADALIVSSPTGSSAYNFAAGGPVFYPDMEALILNALCAHRMRVTPLVVPPDSVLQVSLRPRRPEDFAQVLTDGQPWLSMADAETLKISRADVYLPLVIFENDFYGKLRDKLRWGGLF
jgi:NAD+ kinase